jgi:hypothetical protein
MFTQTINSRLHDIALRLSVASAILAPEVIK